MLNISQEADEQTEGNAVPQSPPEVFDFVNMLIACEEGAQYQGKYHVSTLLKLEFL